MSDSMTEEGAPPEPVVEPPAASPWDPWQQAGWDPATANPFEARQAYDYYKGLQNRDQRDFYIEQTLKGHELPEGMTWAEAREAIQSVAKAKADPWAQYGQEDPEAGLYEPQAYTTEQIDGVVQARIDAALAAERQRAAQERQEYEVSSAFQREYERISTENNLQPFEAQGIGAQVAAALEVNPGAPIRELFAQAYSQYESVLDARLAERAMRQGQGPNTTSPTSTGQTLNPSGAINSLADVRRALNGE